MTVGGHEFDAIEARFLRVERGGTVLLNDIGDLHCFQRPVWRRLRKAIRRHDENARICPIGWIDRCGDGRLARHRDVCRAASMPQLGEHVAALGVDRTRDALPARHLLIAVDSRRASIAASRRCNRRRLGENQTAIGGTLAIVFEHQIARNATRPLSAEPTQRRHNDAMFERDRPDLHRREQLIVGTRNHRNSPCG